jgi:hypothetical protein
MNKGALALVTIGKERKLASMTLGPMNCAP